MVDGVLSVVVVVFVLLENTRGLIKLELDLGGQSALEVDNPEGLLLANSNALNLSGKDLDLPGLLKVFLILDADFLSGVDFAVLLHNIFVELLSLGVQEGNVQGALLDGLDDQATLDGATGNLSADTQDASGSPAGIIVLVGVTSLPDLASGDGGLEGQAINVLVATLNSFQVQVGGNLAALINIASAEVGVANVLPGLLTVQDALLDLVDLVGLLEVQLDGLLDLGGADEAAGQVAVVEGGGGDGSLAGARPVIGLSVDDQGAFDNAAGRVFIQGHQRGDQVDVSAGRRTRESLYFRNIDVSKFL